MDPEDELVKLSPDDEGVAYASEAPHLRLKAKTKAKAKLKTSSHLEAAAATPADAARGVRASFLVRIWRAEDAGDPAATFGEEDAHGWRGVVEHIQSGARLTFEDEAGLFKFMTEQARRQRSKPPDYEEIDQFIAFPDD